MRRLFDALCRLLAPILAFTADEAWEYAGHRDPVHLERFPEPGGIDEAAAATVAAWLPLRARIAQGIEKARQSKTIGKALEAGVVLRIADPATLATLQGREAEFAEFCLLSTIRIEPGTETAVEIERTADPRCGRCWRHLPSVGAQAAHADLCDRCADVVGA